MVVIHWHYFNGSAVSSTYVLLPMPTEFWCTLLLQIVKATSRHASTVGKLQGIINLTKNVAISSYFIGALPSLMYDALPPFGIKANSWLGGYDCWLQPHTFYLETKFLWNKMGSDGISAAGHIAIIKYHMFVLLASVVDRYFPYYSESSFSIFLLITAPTEIILTRTEIYLSSGLARYTGNVTY